MGKVGTGRAEKESNEPASTAGTNNQQVSILCSVKQDSTSVPADGTRAKSRQVLVALLELVHLLLEDRISASFENHRIDGWS